MELQNLILMFFPPVGPHGKVTKWPTRPTGSGQVDQIEQQSSREGACANYAHDIPHFLRCKAVTPIKIGVDFALLVAFERQDVTFINSVANS